MYTYIFSQHLLFFLTVNCGFFLSFYYSGYFFPYKRNSPDISIQIAQLNYPLYYTAGSTEAPENKNKNAEIVILTTIQ